MAIDAISDLSISASVGANGRNIKDDVATIQEALNQVPKQSGGPFPLLAVDGLCGPKTRKAIAEFQVKQFGWGGTDGRVDPERRTIIKLGEFQERANAQTTGTATAGAPGSVSEFDRLAEMHTVYAKLPEAMSWIHAALRTLDRAEHVIQNTAIELTLDAAGRDFVLVDKYFDIIRLPKPRQLGAIQFVRRVFQNMRMCIGHFSQMTLIGTGYFQYDPTKQNPKDQHLAFTYFGGFTRVDSRTKRPPVNARNGLRMDAIYMATKVLGAYTLEVITNTIVHELAHFVGPENRGDGIRDHSYRHKPSFFKLPHFQRLRTADYYNEFAGEAKLGREVDNDKAKPRFIQLPEVIIR
ncbi:MAG: peptidoglycan-binding protein [Planctomycetota bacterium]|nr:peptidoglycan-binding protein [Planctomycetota bacterium]